MKNKIIFGLMIGIFIFSFASVSAVTTCAKAGENIGGVPSQRTINCCSGLDELTIFQVLSDGACNPAGGAFLCSSGRL